MGKAARLFNGTAEQTLYGRVTPTAEQREVLQTQWNALADHLKEQLAAWGYPISTWLQGSYKYGTLIKPVHKGEEYDVDVGVYFEWNPGDVDISPTPAQLRHWVQRELVEYRQSNPDVERVEEPPKERCSRVTYQRQFHIDTPTYHLNRGTDERRLACLSGKWENSDPKALYKWFKNAIGSDNREQLRRLVRYLKGWAAVAFEEAPASRPSSILLTVLTTEAFSEMWGARLLGIADDDALVAVIESMYVRMHKDRRVRNPVDRDEDLNRISDEAWDAFLTRLTVLRDAAQMSSDAEDEAGAALAWAGAFSFLMPLPETDELEVVEHLSGRALMQIPEIQVQVFDSERKSLLATHMNEVPAVGRNQALTFTIVNRQVIPDFAAIEWTVRNDGTEADYLGDLGHASGGIGMFSVDERTAYVGKHYMDCIIRCNGSVFSARRIPVFISADVRALAKPVQRNWTRLRTRRGRRR
ncbi:hypothetical protein B0G80_2022 [Paraburkholderia sp. BL6669N2]|uniref:CBASS cGAMP synthase n=1 Tax=Paraburkholderia sp. BL6669N2 TaxID=1938807 RepID=UPI000E228031|nr:nucleotidyltransferase [Paraburkholderia sp. BL6669N2]REG59287.1 hypothetical protein B0G80_2022 [Paraburkholderia sp. BL6669N2]